MHIYIVLIIKIKNEEASTMTFSVALQVYSVRDFAEKNLKDTLAKGKRNGL